MPGSTSGTRGTRAARGAYLRGRIRPAAAVALLPVVLFCMAGCGSPVPAGQHSSASVAGYVRCLSEHPPGGARHACKSLRPPGGLGPAVTAVMTCLRAHGVAVPDASAPAGSRGQAVWRFLAGLRSGTPAQQSAFHSCITRAGQR